MRQTTREDIAEHEETHHMSNITRINLPVTNDIRLKNVEDGSEDGLWVAAGPQSAIAEAVKAGGVHVMTRRGPRVILVDRIVKLSSGLAIVPIEPDFEQATKVTKTNAVTDLSEADLVAALAKLRGENVKPGANTKPVTSGGKNGRSGTTTVGKPAATTKTTTVTKSAAAAAAVEDVDDADLTDLLVS